MIILQMIMSPSPPVPPLCPVSAVQGARPVVKRWAPLVAVATANCINIPMMRQRELINGVLVVDEEGEPRGQSKVIPPSPPPLSPLLSFLLDVKKLFSLLQPIYPSPSLPPPSSSSPSGVGSSIQRDYTGLHLKDHYCSPCNE